LLRNIIILMEKLAKRQWQSTAYIDFAR